MRIQCAICPGLFVNICRRISLSYIRVPGDVFACALAEGEPSSVASIQRRLELYLDDLREHDDLTQEDRSNIDLFESRFGEALISHE